jgi:hypothetical protein
MERVFAMSDDYEVAPVWYLRQKYGLTAANRPTIRLDPSRVPEKYRPWIPMAERWGVGDDIIRGDCVDNASTEELTQLLYCGEALDDIFEDWLAGPESHSPNPSEEYVAFTCLIMAWDEAKLIEKRRNESDSSQV